MRLALTLSLLLVATSNSLARVNIEAYCEDMRIANNYSREWASRCVATNEVQEKYKNIEEGKVRKYQELKSKNDVLFELIDLDKLLKSSHNPDEMQAIKKKMKPLCATYDYAEMCDGF